MLSVLLLSSSAFAWSHIGLYWTDDKFPIKWWFDDDVIEDSLPQDTDLQVAIIQTSFDNWPEYATCAGLSNEYQGLMQLDVRDPDDGKSTIQWEDPDDEAEPGVLGTTYPNSSGAHPKTANGTVYYAFSDSDIVFNNDVDFATTEDMIAGVCAGETSIESVATHEIGHLHGLDHSCQQGDPCTEVDLKEATMNWSASPCDYSGIDLNVDDVASINALYGVYGTFSATSPTSGAAPFTVTFEVESEAEVASVHWEWGDGTEEDGGKSGRHEYTTSGSFTVRASMELVDPECGTTTYDQTEVGYVLGCTEPVPEEGATGFFQMSVEDGLVWRAINRTDMSTYGCVDTITWEVYEGTEVNADKMVDFNGDGEGDRIGAWAPQISFPAEGTYTVVMNVGGPGGIAGSKLTVSVVDSAAGSTGCSTSSQLTLVGAALAGAAAMARRRRG